LTEPVSNKIKNEYGLAVAPAHLVKHDAPVGESSAKARFTAGEEDGGHGLGVAHTHGVHGGRDVLLNKDWVWCGEGVRGNVLCCSTKQSCDGQQTDETRTTPPLFSSCR
jgi:hypothetical protein